RSGRGAVVSNHLIEIVRCPGGGTARTIGARTRLKQLNEIVKAFEIRWGVFLFFMGQSYRRLTRSIRREIFHALCSQRIYVIDNQN
ncbi:MAG: hypothetical protein QX198_18315, partial [Methylococcaceae bacterium]